MANIEIRKYEQSVDTQLLDYHSDRTIVHIGNTKMSILLGQSDFLELFTPDGIWLALDGEVVVGVILIGMYHEVSLPYTAVYGIKVDEIYRRRGIAFTLMQKADTFTEAINVNRIILHTQPDNSPALALFIKCGFSTIESTDEILTVEKIN